MSTADYTVSIDWNDDGDFSDTGENVTARVLRTGGTLTFQYGRDQARSLSAIRAGETAFSLNNESKDYMPDNASSPLYGNLEPGKPVLIQGTFSAVTYDLFRGFLDGYDVQPKKSSGVSVVKMSALDLLHKLAQATLSTELHQSIQSGEAIDVLLDEIGWPEADRDLDKGATTLRWWWEEGTDGLTALKKILDSEGPASFAFITSDGKLAFRDRHHRLTRSASTAVQATFRSSGAEPLFSEPFEYNVGWRDLINRVDINVSERAPLIINTVWSTTEAISLIAGESRILTVVTQEPFFAAETPIVGDDEDIVLRSGTDSNLEVTLSRTSGQSTEIRLVAAAAVIIDTVKLRAQSVPVARTLKVSYEDPESIEKHGIRAPQEITPAWANGNDALAIARLIVAQRAKRLPVVSITVNNANDTRLTQILTRDLSDRIHIIESDETGLADDFFIENIRHDISDAGKVHKVTFGCEQASVNASQTPNYFTFDQAGSGFGQGVFGEDGLLELSRVFILGDATNGKLDTAGLGF